MQKKYKVLVSCYACSPFRGSEPGMGWNFVECLSNYHVLHVITEEVKWQEDIEKVFSSNPELAQNLTFHFIAKKRNKWLRKIWPSSYYWYYKKWQKKAYKLAKDLNEEENFDIIHQLNMVGFREPGYLWKIDKPFVWGPIGGLEITPWRFLSVMGLYGSLHYFSRNIINLFQRRFLVRPQQAATRENSKLIAATLGTKESINKLWETDAEVISEVGTIPENGATEIYRRSSNEPLKIVWSGLHIPRKALNLLIAALQKLKHLNIELHVLGDGKSNKKWKKLSKKRDVNGQIYWHGWVKKSEAHQVMSKGHLFCITSLHDLTSTVTLEALSLGLPIICLDHCGFAEVVNESCGIKIPVTNSNRVITGFANAIKKLYKNESLRLRLSRGALERAKDYNWDNKVLRINKLYNQLVDGKR